MRGGKGLIDGGKKLLLREKSRYMEHLFGLEFPNLGADYLEKLSFRYLTGIPHKYVTPALQTWAA